MERAWWLSSTLIYVDGGPGRLPKAVYNISTSMRVSLPDYVHDVELVDAETVCYGRLEEAGCTSLADGDSFWLTPPANPQPGAWPWNLDGHPSTG